MGSQVSRTQVKRWLARQLYKLMWSSSLAWMSSQPPTLHYCGVGKRPANSWRHCSITHALGMRLSALLRSIHEMPHLLLSAVCRSHCFGHICIQQWRFETYFGENLDCGLRPNVSDDLIASILRLQLSIFNCKRGRRKNTFFYNMISKLETCILLQKKLKSDFNILFSKSTFYCTTNL
jgi:hypothetical protein